MIKLSSAAIFYAVMKCIETPNYKIIIALSNASGVKEVFEACSQVIKVLGLDRPVSQCRCNSFQITFANKSQIKSVIANENARGHAAHLVIYDSAILKDIKYSVLRPLEKMEE